MPQEGNPDFVEYVRRHEQSGERPPAVTMPSTELVTVVSVDQSSQRLDTRSKTGKRLDAESYGFPEGWRHEVDDVILLIATSDGRWRAFPSVIGKVSGGQIDFTVEGSGRGRRLIATVSTSRGA